MRKKFASGVLTRRSLLAGDVLTYALCEDLTGALLGFMLVFSPWAFGTTEPWSIWTMNGCAYDLGILLAIKMAIRWKTGWKQARAECGPTANQTWPSHQLCAKALTGLTGLLLLYCFVSAVNARATCNPSSGQIEYHCCLYWLPHSLDAAGSWQAFLRIFALVCSFWAVHDWLRRAQLSDPPLAAVQSDATPAPRLNSLLWLLTISGGLLALEGIVQRAANSPKLLFLVTPQLQQEPATQFAAYAYRANAGQYFNLLWPVCFGFWWRGYRLQTNRGMLRQLGQLGCIAVMAVCPIVSTARGAGLADFGMLIILLAASIATALIGKRQSRERGRAVALVICALAGLLVIAAGLGWKQLGPRMQQARADLRSREELYQTARLIAQDYELFGTGPGTFGSVFQLYRPAPTAYWPAQLHNDWLEARLTFGWAGSGLIGMTLLVVVVGAFARGWSQKHWPLAFCCFLALAGCLVQAYWDFPLQVYSIVFLFTIWCSVLFSCVRRVRVRGHERHFRGNYLHAPRCPALDGRIRADFKTSSRT